MCVCVCVCVCVCGCGGGGHVSLCSPFSLVLALAFSLSSPPCSPVLALPLTPLYQTNPSLQSNSIVLCYKIIAITVSCMISAYPCTFITGLMVCLSLGAWYNSQRYPSLPRKLDLLLSGVHRLRNSRWMIVKI